MRIKRLRGQETPGRRALLGSISWHMEGFTGPRISALGSRQGPVVPREKGHMLPLRREGGERDKPVVGVPSGLRRGEDLSISFSQKLDLWNRWVVVDCSAALEDENHLRLGERCT